MLRPLRWASLVFALASAFVVSSATAEGDVGSAAPQTIRKAQETSPPQHRRDAGATVGSAAHAALAAGDPQRALVLVASGKLGLPATVGYSIEGRAYLQLGDNVQARRKLEKAVRLRPRYAPDLYWLGRAYAACGMPALAASRFREAHLCGLDSADLHYHWAEALRATGKRLGEISQRTRPDEPDGRVKVGTFVPGGLVVGSVPGRPDRWIVSPPDSAIYEVHRALERPPERGAILFLTGMIWAEVDRHDQAVLRFAQAAGHLKGEDLARCHAAWGESLLAGGDVDGYLEQLQARMGITGEIDGVSMAECYDRAAQETARRGDLRRQVRFLKLAAELKPDVGRLIRLSDALMLAQQSRDAGRTLQAALKLDPSPHLRKDIMLRLQRTTRLASPPKP